MLARPSLLAVLEAASGQRLWRGRRREVRHIEFHGTSVSWHQTMPYARAPARTRKRAIAVRSAADVLESLVARGLWPWPVEGDGAAAWHCEACAGYGIVARVEPRRYVPCSHCSVGPSPRSPGWSTKSLTIDAVISVASLGVDQLLRVAHLADEIVRGCVVVWRPMDGVSLWHWHRANQAAELCLPGARDEPSQLRDVFSFETLGTRHAERSEGGRWPETCPWPAELAHVHRAWPAMRALADIDVHLLGCDSRSVTLCVLAP